ncbi:MAG: cell division ATP-binding protein FtsE [bacterium]|nr:cell division ATP-binding protein FtsE [bacterium]
MIEFSAVQKFYPPKQVALQSVDLSIKEGEFVFLVGASGAGKSTLMKLLFGAETISKGSLKVDGKKISSLDADDLALLRRNIGVVFQDYKLLNRRTVIENVAFPLELRGIRRAKMMQLGKSILEAVGLGERTESLPQTLSGGEQQRVAIARALITKPKILLADEPTGNLDPAMSRNVLELLLDAHRCGTTVIVATHNLPLIEDLKLRTIVLDRGKIIGDFPTAKGLN